MATPVSSTDLVGAFRPARRVRILDDVTAQLQKAIISGRLQPGDRLPSERELAEAFGVGRPTLREALRVLEAFDLVEIRPGKRGGAFVTTPSQRPLTRALATLLAVGEMTRQDLVEFRITFEAENAWWAAKRATSADVAELREIAAEAESTWNHSSGPELFPEIDARWHGAVARLTKNKVRLCIFLGLYETLLRYNLSLTVPPVGHRDALAEQLRFAASDMELIARSIELGDSETARTQMRLHIERGSGFDAGLARIIQSTSLEPDSLERAARRLTG